MATELAVSGNVTMQRATLAPTTFEEAKAFAEYLSKSDMVPKQYVGRPANIVVAMQHGMEIGLPVLQSLQAIAVINGVPSLWGDSMLAIVMSHPAYEFHDEYIEGEGDSRVAVFEIKRRGHKLHTSRFSIADAKKADLWDTRTKVTRRNRDGNGTYEVPNDSPWYCYPERMLKFRARGFGLRDKFPDALKGMVSREEVMDYRGVTLEGAVEPETITATTVHENGKADPKVEPLKKITQDQAREFGKAWKASGHTMEAAKAALQRIGGVASSLDLPTDKYDEAMKWAKQKPATEQISAEEEACRKMFGILGYDLEAQAKAITDANGDWRSLASRLSKETPAGE